MLRSVPSSVWWLIAFVVIFFSAINGVKSALDRPTVFTSYETRECVRAENAKGEPMACEAATAGKYRNVWVY